MMDGYTKGLLYVPADADKKYGDLGLYTVNGTYPNALGINGGVGIASLVASVRGEGYNPAREVVRNTNASRLALCWNTLHGLDNTTVERLGKWLDAHNGDELAQMLTEEGF